MSTASDAAAPLAKAFTAARPHGGGATRSRCAAASQRAPAAAALLASCDAASCNACCTEACGVRRWRSMCETGATARQRVATRGEAVLHGRALCPSSFRARGRAAQLQGLPPAGVRATMWRHAAKKLVAPLSFGLASAGLATVAAADEAEHGLHAGQYPWPHNGFFSSYDHASIRRGHQVRRAYGGQLARQRAWRRRRALRRAFGCSCCCTALALKPRREMRRRHAGVPAGVRRVPLGEPVVVPQPRGRGVQRGGGQGAGGGAGGAPHASAARVASPCSARA